MKRWLKPVYAGISGKKVGRDKYQMQVDFENNSPDDIIKFLKPYTTKLGDHIYWFGYKYNEGINDRALYESFIEFIKNVQNDDSVEYRLNEEEGVYVPYSPEHIIQSELDSMIIRSLNGIGIDRYSVDTIVYPGSSNHNLVRCMIDCIKRYLKTSDRITYVQLNKLACNEVELDRKRFIDDLYDRHPDLEGMSPDTIYKLQQDLENKGNKPFSIRKDISPKELRRYVREMFQKESEEALVNSHRVLVVDDFKTSGTTIMDIIDNIEKVNDQEDLEIYVFTLMGNFKKA